MVPIATGAAADGRRMEEIAMAWVEAHNSGDIETMATFRAAHREDTNDAWRDQFPSLVERLGILEPTDVMIERQHELILQVDSDVRGRLQFTFWFNPDDPERISRIFYVRLFNGILRPGDEILLMSSKESYEVQEVGNTGQSSARTT